MSKRHCLGSFWYNANTEEITFDSDFSNEHYIIKLDMIQDFIYLLEDEYNKIMEENKDG